MEIHPRNKIVRLDHRRFPRTEPTDPLMGTVVISGKRHTTKVRDYSPKGVSLQFDMGFLGHMQDYPLDIRLELGETCFEGSIRHTHEQQDYVLAGVALRVIEPKGEISFTDEDPGWDLIEDETTLKNLFSDLTFKGPEVLVKLKQINGHAEVFAKEIRDETLVLEVHETKRGDLQKGFCTLRFEMFQTSHAFDSRITNIEKDMIEVSLPKKIARLLRRETVRVPNGTNNREITVELESRMLGKTKTPLEVYEYSEHGMAILDHELWLNAPVGVPIEKIILRTNNGKVIEGRGTIRGHRWIAEKDQYAVGIYFETSNNENRTLWHDFILEARYPLLSFNYQDSDHSKIWELFDRSGYLGLKPRESFNYVYDISKSTWTSLHNAGTKLSKRVMIRRDQKVLGHLQIDRIYPDTWCAHALAVDPSVFKTVGKDIYAITADVLSAERSNYIISITESHLSWNQRNYYDFVKTYRYPDHNELKLFQIHEAEMSKGWNLPAYKGLETRVANQYDMARIIRYFELHTSLLEREALGLTEHHLNLSQLSQEYSEFALTRKRDFVIGYLNGEFVGFAHLETGTTGISIFGIQDTMYVFLVPSLKEDRSKIYDAILAAGLEKYRDYNVPTVNIYVPDMRREELSDQGLKFIWEGVRWISRRETAKRFHSYIQNMYGHLILKRELIRKRRTSR
ncbi:MAG: hypothetical protein KDD48_01545 [Bdellovibrionales bacterium]|nr:hypothetical protein [Bdellovibrionales bacterium]